eukprot:TRINITY_DN41871_c0_g1_i1.p1 TRINITY_DN41871_c0_g1~~TRINITY_DN41871_c0_g1_i1.p1  ORF type:complete len:195 (-),score=41.11 TRINITY_DN41871_c0_g1_i1:25-609(-)
MIRTLLLIWMLVAPASAYVSSSIGASSNPRAEEARVSKAERTAYLLSQSRTATAERSNAGDVAAMGLGLGLGSLLAWLNSCKRQVASASLAAGVAVASSTAVLAYDTPETAKGKIDINNAPMDAYAKLPGFYPTGAAVVRGNRPYTDVKDLFKLKDEDPRILMLFKKYEDKLAALPRQKGECKGEMKVSLDCSN